MPYKLRKAPGRDLYWVVATDGSHKSKEPLPLAKAKAQMKALYANAEDVRGGATLRERGLASFLRENYYFPEGSPIYPIYQFLSAIIHSPNNKPMPYHPWNDMIQAMSEDGAIKSLIKIAEQHKWGRYIKPNEDWNKPPKGYAVVPVAPALERGAPEPREALAPPPADAWKKAGKEAPAEPSPSKGPPTKAPSMATVFGEEEEPEESSGATVKPEEPSGATAKPEPPSAGLSKAEKRAKAKADKAKADAEEEKLLNESAITEKMRFFDETYKTLSANPEGKPSIFELFKDMEHVKGKIKEYERDQQLIMRVSKAMEEKFANPSEDPDKVISPEDQKKVLETIEAEKTVRKEIQIYKQTLRETERELANRPEYKLIEVLRQKGWLDGDEGFNNYTRYRKSKEYKGKGGLVGGVIAPDDELIDMDDEEIEQIALNNAELQHMIRRRNFLRRKGGMPEGTAGGSLNGGGWSDYINPSRILNEISNPDSILRRRVTDVTKGIRVDYPPHSRSTLENYGDYTIQGLSLRRVPIQSALHSAFQLITLGEWNKARAETNKDKLFHLGIVLALRGIGGRRVSVLVEKNEVINVATTRGDVAGAETITTLAPLSVTLDDFLAKARRAVGDERFFKYDPFTNNCQDFVALLLSANGVYTPVAQQFVKQPIEDLLSRLPGWTHAVAKGITDLGGVANVALEGGKVAESPTPPNPLSRAEYLSRVRAKAKSEGYPYKLLGYADDGVHKFQIPNKDGKIIRFGRTGYGDFIIWSALEASGKAKSGMADMKRRTFHSSHSKIRGNWKSDQFSPNNLALKILW